MTNRLDKSDWIAAGLKALQADGIDAVRVEPLAAKLKVTKGSFYWHFKDRPALLSALLECWQRRATNAIIDEVETVGGPAKAQLRKLFEIVLQADGRLEMAIRNWAKTDKAAARAVKSIDKKRIGYVANLFEDDGFTAPEARMRARFAYFALIGQYTIAESGPGLGAANEFDSFFKMLSSRLY